MAEIRTKYGVSCRFGQSCDGKPGCIAVYIISTLSWIPIWGVKIVLHGIYFEHMLSQRVSCLIMVYWLWFCFCFWFCFLCTTSTPCWWATTNTITLTRIAPTAGRPSTTATTCVVWCIGAAISKSCVHNQRKNAQYECRFHIYYYIIN